MAVEPAEERVMAAMTQRLRTIAAGPGSVPSSPKTVDYWSTPTRVTRSLLALDQYKDTDFPLLGVMRTSGSVMRQLDHAADSLRVNYEHRLQVAVWGYVLGDPEEKPGGQLAGTRLNRLWHDHMACLLLDPGLGGICVDLRPDPDISRDTDDGAREPRAFFRQMWIATAFEAL